MFTSKTSLIIPTKDRSKKIIKLLERLFSFKIKFGEILVIDSSNKSHSKKVKIYCQKKKIRYFFSKPSTSHQRNIGLKKAKKFEFIMFMDDDVILYKNTFIKMSECINKNFDQLKIGGFGFNQVDKVNESLFDKLKKINLFDNLNIYPAKAGMVAKSGWHSKILNLKKDVLADWVFTTICIYKRRDIIGYKFDESFGKYSYLEDLDFSLNLKKKNKKIYISSKAKFKHPLNVDRSSFSFGIIEIINRFKIIKKHGLSKKLFVLGCLLRFIISVSKILTLNHKYFLRAMGNIYGFFLLSIKI